MKNTLKTGILSAFLAVAAPTALADERVYYPGQETQQPVSTLSRWLMRSFDPQPQRVCSSGLVDHALHNHYSYLAHQTDNFRGLDPKDVGRESLPGRGQTARLVSEYLWSRMSPLLGCGDIGRNITAQEALEGYKGAYEALLNDIWSEEQDVIQSLFGEEKIRRAVDMQISRRGLELGSAQREAIQQTVLASADQVRRMMLDSYMSIALFKDPHGGSNLGSFIDGIIAAHMNPAPRPQPQLPPVITVQQSSVSAPGPQ